MPKTIYPCLWFSNNAKEVADFYCSIFSDAKIESTNPIVTAFTASGIRFMCLNGGDTYKINAAISYYVYCGSEVELDRIYTALIEGGNAVMPLGKYDWAKKYAWVVDKFGVNWQMDMDDINSTQKIVPTLLFANEKFTWVKKALSTYTTIFKPRTVLIEAPYPTNPAMPEGTLLFTQFKLGHFIFNAMSSTLPHDFDFACGNSFVIECDTQEEIDYYWEQLGNNGRYDRCGWLADELGVSWQIVPSILPTLMADPKKSQKVIEAFLKMQKFDIATLLSV